MEGDEANYDVDADVDDEDVVVDIEMIMLLMIILIVMLLMMLVLQTKNIISLHLLILFCFPEIMGRIEMLHIYKKKVSLYRKESNSND
jgi:hypothetical protein